MAAAKLNYGMKTEKEMVGILLGDGYTPAEVDEAVAYLKEYSYIDDERYVKSFYMSGRDKNWSEFKIFHELSEKGIPKEKAEVLIDDYKASVEYEGLKDDNAYALRLGIKMANHHISEGKIMDEKFFGKVGRRLVDLGYRKSTVYYVIDKLRPGNHGGFALDETPADMAEMLAKIKLAQEKLENRIEQEVKEEEVKEREREAIMYDMIYNRN